MSTIPSPLFALSFFVASLPLSLKPENSFLFLLLPKSPFGFHPPNSRKRKGRLFYFPSLRSPFFKKKQFSSSLFSSNSPTKPSLHPTANHFNRIVIAISSNQNKSKSLNKVILFYLTFQKKTVKRLLLTTTTFSNPFFFFK
jgi:hypothetical protein